MQVSYNTKKNMARAWAFMALSAVPHTVYNCDAPYKRASFFLLTSDIEPALTLCRHRSPWQFVWDLSPGLTPPLVDFPEIVDINLGRTYFSLEASDPVPEILPIWVVQISCPQCLSTDTHIIDHVDGSYLPACRDMSCNLCGALVWPWRPLYAAELTPSSSITPFHNPNPKGHSPHA